MFRIFDLQCTKCNHTWDAMVYKHHDIWDLPECPECRSNFVVRLPGGLKHFKDKDPYDVLERKGPDVGKKIFSGPKVSSK